MRACVLGHFAFGLDRANGQTIKTKIVAKELVRQYGEREVKLIDTYGSIRSLLLAPLHTFGALKSARDVIMLPAHNGVRIYGRLLPWMRNVFFKKKRIHYVVIGGWLPEFVENRKSLAKALKEFDSIYVETNAMKSGLEAQGFTNILVVPNCKELEVLTEDALVYSTEEPYRLCTFSRVMKQKGIADAAAAVEKINTELGRTAFSLDIFGQVDSDQTEWFEELKKTFPAYVRYGGLIPFAESVSVLKNYYTLLFPTYYEGEGFAGTLIDAFSAGIPVIASNWRYNGELVDHKKTGLLYSLEEKDGLENALRYALENADALNAIKPLCLQKAQNYVPEKALQPLLQKMEE